MKVGDLVRCNSPHSWSVAAHFGGGFRHGIIIEEMPSSRALNKLFKVLWQNNGEIGNNVWDYDLKVVDESR